jgi:hypothetical protein
MFSIKNHRRADRLIHALNEAVDNRPQRVILESNPCIRGNMKYAQEVSNIEVLNGKTGCSGEDKA